jgi:hypothetical protein
MIMFRYAITSRDLAVLVKLHAVAGRLVAVRLLMNSGSVNIGKNLESCIPRQLATLDKL